MSSNQTQDDRTTETLDGILKDAGMKNFENANQQAMRMRAAGVLIGHFRETSSDVFSQEVGSGNPDEPDLAGSVEATLVSSPELDSTDIFVSAAGSEITLAGWVRSHEAIANSSAIAADVSGVEVVHNELSKSL